MKHHHQLISTTSNSNKDPQSTMSQKKKMGERGNKNKRNQLCGSMAEDIYIKIPSIRKYLGKSLNRRARERLLLCDLQKPFFFIVASIAVDLTKSTARKLFIAHKTALNGVKHNKQKDAFTMAHHRLNAID